MFSSIFHNHIDDILLKHGLKDLKFCEIECVGKNVDFIIISAYINGIEVSYQGELYVDESNIYEHILKIDGDNLIFKYPIWFSNIGQSYRNLIDLKKDYLIMKLAGI